MVIVTAVLTAKAGRQEELKAKALALVDKVKQEPGALEYALHQCTDNPAVFHFHERYVDRQAFDKHLATPYLAEFLAQGADLLACPAQVNTFTELARIPVKDAAHRG